MLAPDFIGYGQSGAWPADRVFTGKADVDVLLRLAKKTRRPFHLVGHSYGAVMALLAARELGPKVKSLALVEPVAFNLLRVENRPEWAEVERLGVQVLTPSPTATIAPPRRLSCAIGSDVSAGSSPRKNSRRRSPRQFPRWRWNS